MTKRITAIVAMLLALIGRSRAQQLPRRCTAIALSGVALVALSSVPVVLPAAEPASAVTLEGTVLIQVEDDFEQKRSHTRYFLLDRQSNERLELQLSPQQAKRLRPGQELRIRGGRGGKVLAVDPGADAVTVLGELASLAPPDTARRVINIIIDITDGSGITHAIHGECDGTEQILAGDMFGVRGYWRNLDGCYRESSNERVAFGGASYPGTAKDVVRVAITEPAPSLAGICPYDAWAARADAAAGARGVDLSAYQHRMYVLPWTTTGCSWAGLAYVGCGESCQAWVRAFTDNQHSTGPCGLRDALAHELGHNLGMWHARTDSNNDGISDCEYCDTTDIMGYAFGTWRGFNAPRRDHMGGLGTDRIVDGAGGGVFTISALGMQNSPYPQVVKVVPPSGWPYWLSYRAPVGYDAAIFETWHFDKLHVHRADEWGYTYLITELADGAAHVDENLNLTVRQISHTADSTTLDVQYGPSFSLSAGSLEFGTQLLNLPASRQTISLFSNGGATLSIASIAIGGANSDQFAQTNNCGTSLAPGASCAIEVAFKPTSAGSKVATLSVTADGGAGTRAASLSGTGAESAFLFIPHWLDFGVQPLNVTSSVKTTTLYSTGIKALPITSIVMGGLNPGDYAQTNNCRTSVAVGASCTINVTFKPANGGSRSADLIVTGGNGAGAQHASLSGIGVKAAYTLSTTALEFGNQLLNVASSAQTITLRSTGVVALPITSIAMSGTNPTDFPTTNNCGTSVAVGASCTITVTFKPTSSGPRIASLKVTASGGAGIKRVLLTGNGVRAAHTLSTTSLVFGNQALNLVSSGKTITLRNTGGTILPITSIAVGGINPHMFAQTHNCGTSVAVGASCAIKVTFKPTIAGSKVATLRVTAGGGAGTKSTTLSGTGVRSTFSVSPTALSFGNVARNTTSTAKTVRISNTGGVVLPISSIAFAGTNTGQFARTHNCPARVAVGGSCTVSVVFKPTSTGVKSAILQVTPGGGAAMRTVSLSGTGI